MSVRKVAWEEAFSILREVAGSDNIVIVKGVEGVALLSAEKVIEQLEKDEAFGFHTLELSISLPAEALHYVEARDDGLVVGVLYPIPTSICPYLMADEPEDDDETGPEKPAEAVSDESRRDKLN